MPTLVRFLVVLIVLAAIGLAGMFYLANFVEPHTREMTVKVPADKLQPKDVTPAAVAVQPAPAEAAPGSAAPAEPALAQPAPAEASPAQPAPAAGQPAKPPKPLND